jgi:hypothetical protein
MAKEKTKEKKIKHKDVLTDASLQFLKIISIIHRLSDLKAAVKNYGSNI